MNTVDLFPCVGASPQNIRWGQLIDFPSVFGSIEIVSRGNAKEEGVATLTRLSRIFAGMPHLPPLSQLKKKIDITNIKSLAVCFQQGKKCELVLLGEGKIYLRRGKILSPLLSHEGKLSGEIHEGDCLIFLSETAVKIIDAEVQELFSPKLTAKEVSQAFDIRLTQLGIKGEGAAIVVAQVLKEEVDESLPIITSHSPSSSGIQIPHISLRAILRNPRHLRYGIVFLVSFLFIVSVVLGILHQKNDVAYQHRQDALSQAKRIFDEGVSLTDSQPINSREDFQKALQILSPYTGKNLPLGKEGRDFQSLQNQINDSLKLVSKVYTADVQLFYDASFLEKGRVVSLFTVGSDALAFADTNSGTIGLVSLTSKDADVVAGGSEYTSTKFLTFQDTRLLIVTNDGVKAIDEGKDGVTSILTPSEKWDAFATFGNNLYGVVRSSGEIIRYPAKEEGGFGEKEEYLADDVHDDLSQSTGMVIDGSVWLGSTIGKIYRYTQGRDDSFLIQGVDPVLGQHLEVYVDADDPLVYIFDPEEKRIVLLSKDGVYQAQYVYGDTIHPTAFSVSSAQKKVFLLANQKIYSFSIE